MTDIIDTANYIAQALLNNQIRNIKSAQTLNDIDECIDCGEPIGKKRKQIMPSAIRCVGCQWRYECTHERR